MSKKETHRKIIAQNRKARYDYKIIDTIEAGIMLTGSEVKSLRLGQCSIKESYASDEDGLIVLINSDIPEYQNSSYNNHTPKRHRVLLLKKKQIQKLIGAVNKKGVALVPISIYFNDRGIAKLELGIAEGKKQHDKRESIKEREWNRQKERIMKER